MLRGLLIAICSSVVLSASWATVVVEGSGGDTAYSFGSTYDHDNGGQLVGLFAAGESIAAGSTKYSDTFVFSNVTCRVAITADESGIYLFREALQAGGTWTRSYGFGVTVSLGSYIRSTGEWTAPTVVETAPDPTPTPTPEPTPSPTPFESSEFTYYFPSGFEGALLEIRDSGGNVVFSEVIPVGGEVSGFVAGESLSGYEVSIDGLVQGDFNSFAPANLVIERPGFNLSFDRSYTGGEWQARANDGSVLASGSTDSAAVGRITVAQGAEATVWTRVPAGDGQGAAWVPTPVSLGGNTTTTYAFANNPNPAPVPTPATPMASPAPSPLPAPSPVGVTDGSTVTPAAVSTNDVSVDVGELPVPESHDGEEGVLESVVAMHEKIRGILNDFESMFSNVALTYQEFNRFAFGGVGQACTLQFGPVVLDLGNIVPGFVRSGLKLIILMTVVFGAIRLTWDTFTSY